MPAFAEDVVAARLTGITPGSETTCRRSAAFERRCGRDIGLTSDAIAYRRSATVPAPCSRTDPESRPAAKPHAAAPRLSNNVADVTSGWRPMRSHIVALRLCRRPSAGPIGISTGSQCAADRGLEKIEQSAPHADVFSGSNLSKDSILTRHIAQKFNRDRMKTTPGTRHAGTIDLPFIFRERHEIPYSSTSDWATMLLRNHRSGNNSDNPVGGNASSRLEARGGWILRIQD